MIKKIIYYANLKNKITIVDPNKGYNDYKKYEGTKFITPNLKELQLIQPKMKNFDTNVQQASIKIINRYNIKTVIATRSEKGISLIQKNKFKNFRVKKKRVYDVSGAGDTVISVLAYLLAKKIDLNLILKICNLSANNVISKSFTIPIEKNEFVKILNKTMNE